MKNNNFLTIVASSPLNGRMEIIYKIIDELGIKSNKSIHILNYDGNNNWFTENLIASLSGIDKYQVSAYFNPCELIGKLYKKNVDKDFLKTIKLLQESNILMTDFIYKKIDQDYLDYFLNYSKDMNTKVKDVYIINTLDNLLTKTNYSKKETLQKINQFAKENNTEVFLITTLKENKKLKTENIIEYENLKQYTKKFILSQKDKNNTLHILMDEKEFICSFNKENNRIGVL